MRLTLRLSHPGPDSNTPESTGKILSVLTSPGEQAGMNVDASKDHPRYKIENANTGKSTAIYEENILGRA
ncbi:hypothetical protein PG993_000316 [Apiospora rasikravindrae]|uniref:Hypervirulence associated protein TUDOR domain-containing protein n=1 Tax=Apiospora rasikravindrae TaxID=990691 RepID=A0ABR1U896_9PEZI